MSITNFPNGISSFGVPVLGGGGIPATPGKVFFVDYGAGSDGNAGTDINEPLKTIAQAYSLVTTNKDDVICLIGNSSHVLTSMLTVAKNRVHFVGLDGSGGRLYGQNAKISMGVTTAATDVFAVKNTGVRNSFTNIKFLSSNTKTEHVSTVGDGGEYAKYTMCEFYASGKQDSNTHSEMILNGDSSQFFDCTFGSLATAVTGDKVRPAILTDNGTVAAGKVARDNYFHNCRFWKKAGGTTTAMIYISADADIERLVELHDCQFVANAAGSTPAVAIYAGGNLTAGAVILTGDTAAFNCTKIATAVGIFSGLTTKVATATIGIQTT